MNDDPNDYFPIEKLEAFTAELRTLCEKHGMMPSPLYTKEPTSYYTYDETEFTQLWETEAYTHAINEYFDFTGQLKKR